MSGNIIDYTKSTQLKYLNLGLEQGRKINMASMFRVSDLELVVSVYNP